MAPCQHGRRRCETVRIRGQAQRKPTLEDVARAAGVSRALVSIVMRGAAGASPETRARVMAVAGELGYRPDARARLLARASSRLLGVVYRVSSLHHADLLAPIYEAVGQTDYELILSGKTPTHDEHQAVNTLLGYRCDALIILGPDLPEAELTDLAGQLPLVLIGRRLRHPAGLVDTIRTDEVAGMRLAVEHLVGLGHRRIAHLDGRSAAMASERRRAFRAAMSHLGLQAEVRVVEAGETALAGRLAGSRALGLQPRPTAVIAYNDDLAWGVMRAAQDAGLSVPDDLSIVGYDASELSRLGPHRLTTVRQDAQALARIGVERAIERLQGATAVNADIVLDPALVEGETSTLASSEPDGR